MTQAGMTIKMRWVLLLLVLCAGAGWIAQQFWERNFLDARSHRLELLQSQSIARVRQIPRAGVVATAPVKSTANPVSIPLESIAELIMAGEIDRALSLYEGSLQDYPDSIEVTQLLAAALLARGDYERGFSLMYEHRLFLSPALEQRLLQAIADEVDRVELALAENEDFDALIRLFQFLISLHGDNPRYYLSLANWQWASGDSEAALSSLDTARHDARYQAELEALEARIMGAAEEALAAQSWIELTKSGDHFVVEVELEHQFPARLMIDTGATMTILDADLVARYGLEPDAEGKELNLNTAGGSVSGANLSLSHLQLGSRGVENIQVGVIPLEQFNFDGLLGMDVLSRFEFSIDQKNGVLHLR